jgi:hypothetical protein
MGPKKARRRHGPSPTNDVKAAVQRAEQGHEREQQARRRDLDGATRLALHTNAPVRSTMVPLRRPQ